MSLLDNYDLFIFDWDCTLSSSTAPVNFIHLLKKDFKFRYARSHPERYRGNVDLRTVEIEEEGSPIISAMYSFYTFFFRPKLKPAAIEALRSLKARRKKIAIFSDSLVNRLFRETRAAKADGYVDAIISAEAIKHYKPDPTGILLAMDRLHVNKKRTLYLGDTASDILTARFAGVDSCGVADGLDTYENLKGAGATYVVRDLGEFIGLLKKSPGRRPRHTNIYKR
ncbi:Pyrophosphatase PpaX [uncultured archaeon]|nr:Pyrophosphatase PpaX [uncultured archaeon]